MSTRTLSTMAQLKTVALFISDLHLQQSHRKTTQAFFDFLKSQAQQTTQLYLLGDVFEYWAGDDDMDDPYHRPIIEAIRTVSDAGVQVFWMAGNRDFLAGQALMSELGATSIPDPYIANIAGLSLTLTHGDAQCTNDLKYMEFRNMVRQPEWQAQFLALPLVKRKEIIAGLRSDSHTEQKMKDDSHLDVELSTIARLFEQTGTSLMIHGHTHRPARHEALAADGSRLVRYVLPDWDYDAHPARGGWVAVLSDGAIQRYRADGNEEECQKIAR